LLRSRPVRGGTSAWPWSPGPGPGAASSSQRCPSSSCRMQRLKRCKVWFLLNHALRGNVPSGDLILMVGTQKWGFSCKVQRRPPADIFLNVSLPPKPHCGHHVHGRHGHGSPVKNCWRFSRFCKKKIQNFDPHFKNLYLARKWV
jgi:hypothetical protein